MTNKLYIALIKDQNDESYQDTLTTGAENYSGALIIFNRVMKQKNRYHYINEIREYELKEKWILHE